MHGACEHRSTLVWRRLSEDCRRSSGHGGELTSCHTVCNFRRRIDRKWTLLHKCLMVESLQPCESRCRQPPEEDDLPLADRSSEEMRALNDAAWQAFWGWDCCGPDGLLERLYKCAGASLHIWT